MGGGFGAGLAGGSAEGWRQWQGRQNACKKQYSVHFGYKKPCKKQYSVDLGRPWGFKLLAKNSTGCTWWSVGRHLGCLGASKFLAKNSTGCTWWFFGIHLGCLGVFLGLQIPCKKQYRMHLVVFGGSIGTYFGSNMAREWSQMAPDRLEMAKDRPKMAEESSKEARDRPQRAQDRPKTAQDRPKTGPRHVPDSTIQV